MAKGSASSPATLNVSSTSRRLKNAWLNWRRSAVGVKGVESLLGGGDLGSDMDLFGLEQFERDGIGVVRVEEPLAFVRLWHDAFG